MGMLLIIINTPLFTIHDSISNKERSHIYNDITSQNSNKCKVGLVRDNLPTSKGESDTKHHMIGWFVTSIWDDKSITMMIVCNFYMVLSLNDP